MHTSFEDQLVFFWLDEVSFLVCELCSWETMQFFPSEKDHWGGIPCLMFRISNSNEFTLHHSTSIYIYLNLGTLINWQAILKSTPTWKDTSTSKLAFWVHSFPVGATLLRKFEEGNLDRLWDVYKTRGKGSFLAFTSYIIKHIQPSNVTFIQSSSQQSWLNGKLVVNKGARFSWVSIFNCLPYFFMKRRAKINNWWCFNLGTHPKITWKC